MTVFVVMKNDYPHGVFSSKEAADSFIKKQADKSPNGYALHWRSYEFVIDGLQSQIS